MESSEGSISNRIRITIRGIVQGVGFRPFVYREAKRLALRGYVINTSEGVVIEACGTPKHLEHFVATLQECAPDRARIDSVTITPSEGEDFDDFEIRDSSGGLSDAAIPLDTALCDACAEEMNDPHNRRFGYPFINCTDCGPRYTIMQVPPYDRVRTSMKHFEMCGECRAEYTDPSSRRYHAEPISCPSCGPQLVLLDPQGNPTGSDPVVEAARMLKEGKIIALKGLGGFHLLCNATDPEAVSELRRRKHRPAKPLAVMFASITQLREYAQFTDAEAEMIGGAIKPIVIVESKPGNRLAESIAPGIGRIGAFLPYTPLHRLLFEQIDFPLVATSANISEEPILIRSEEIVERLGSVVDAIVDHNRPIVNALDDAVVQIVEGNPVVLRLGRGFAPRSWTLEERVELPILALGAHQKNAIAPVVGQTMVLGGHIGDLGSVHADDYFERTVKTFKRFYDFDPQILISDLHPEYSSTRFASTQNRMHKALQHHYAHILACMGEYRLNEKVLGFAFDGTGLGDDGTLWGGEVLIADVHTYDRVYSLKPIRLLGGEKAIREPRRIALSLLFESYSLDEVLSMQLPAVESFLPHEIRQLHHMWTKGLNSPLSSSMGRLFDGVAALGGFVQKLDYEGQGGMLMENCVDETLVEPFGFALAEGVIDIAETVRQIVALYRGNVSQEQRQRVIASRFIATVDAIIHRIADEYPELPVAVGGGVFQNRSLMQRLYRSFSGRRFYAQRSTPINDGGIALGQAWWAVNNIGSITAGE